MAALTPYQRDIVVRTIIGEAANQGPQGQIAVANVIKNRAATGGLWPSDPARVSLQPSQFSTWNSLKNGGNKLARNASPGSSIYQRIGNLVDGVFAGEIGDPTGGATYYYAKGTPRPSWWNKVGGTPLQIGDHLFRSKTGGPTPPGSIPNVAEDDDLVHGPRPQGNVPVLRKDKADPAWTKYAQQKIAENMPWLNLKVDGAYGPKTIAAVRVFQKAAGVKVDGAYGPQTDGAMQDLYPDASESLLPGAVESSALPRLPAMGDSLVDRRDPTVYPAGGDGAQAAYRQATGNVAGARMAEGGFAGDTPRVPVSGIRLPAGGGALSALRPPGTDRISDGMVDRPVTGQQGMPGLTLADIMSRANAVTGRNLGAAGGAAGAPAPQSPFQQLVSALGTGKGSMVAGGANSIRVPDSFASLVSGAGGARPAMNPVRLSMVDADRAGGALAGAGGANPGLGAVPPSDQYFQPGDPNGEANFAKFFREHSDPTTIDLAAAGAAGGARQPPRLSKAGGALGTMPQTDMAGFFKYIGQLFGTAQAQAAEAHPTGTPAASQILANIRSATQPYLGGSQTSPNTLSSFASAFQPSNSGADPTSRVVSTGNRQSATPATESRSSAGNRSGTDSGSARSTPSTPSRSGSDSGSGRASSSSSSSGSRSGSTSSSERR